MRVWKKTGKPVEPVKWETKPLDLPPIKKDGLLIPWIDAKRYISTNPKLNAWVSFYTDIPGI